jgi:biopolymer transport protein ExbB/TolQ
MDFIQTFKEGGFIMYPLAVFSILIVTVAIQKLIFLSKFSTEFKKLHQNAMTSVTANKLGELKWVFKNSSKLISEPHEVLFDDYPLSKEEFNEKVNRRLSETTQGLKSNLWILGTIGSSAPFVGLFGTVLGIMHSFKSIGTAGKSGLAIVGPAISEALIATAAGIIVAVIAVMFYNYFQVKINGINLEFKNKLEDLSELIKIAKTYRKQA